MNKKILSYILKKDLDFWETAKWIGHLADFTKDVKELEKKGLIKIENSKLSLTDKGKNLCKKLDIVPQDLPIVDFPIKIDNNLLKKFKKIRKEVFPKTEFDQLQILPEGVIKKIEVMKMYNDLKGKRIICLGDDDMVGVALPLTRLPKDITILDIDERVIKYENKILEEFGYKKSAFFCNLLKPLPNKFIGKYDVFITEPPDTLEGNTLFFSRGVESLKKEGGVGYLGVSQNDFKRTDYLKLEKNILKMNIFISAIFPKFEFYETYGEEFEWITGLPEGVGLPKKPWFSADLLRTESNEKSKPLIIGTPSKHIKENFIKTNINC